MNELQQFGTLIIHVTAAVAIASVSIMNYFYETRNSCHWP